MVDGSCEKGALNCRFILMVCHWESWISGGWEKKLDLLDRLDHIN